MKLLIVDEGEARELQAGETYGTDVHLVAYCANRMVADNWARAGKETQRTAYYKAKGHVWEIGRYSNAMIAEQRDMGDAESCAANYPDLAAEFFGIEKEV